MSYLPTTYFPIPPQRYDQSYMARLLQEIERAAARTNSKVATDFLNVSNRIDGVEASVEEVATALATLEGAFASYQVTVTAQFNELSALVQTNATAITTLDQAFAAYRVTVEAKFGDANASVETLATAISTLNSAFAQYQTTVTAQFQHVNANVTTVATATADLNSAFAQYQVTVTAAINDALAFVDATYTTSADVTAAIAAYNLTVSTTYATQTALVAVEATANSALGKANATYSLRLDVNGYIVGYTFLNNGSTGDMTIRTDTFKIVTTGQTPKTMFQVANVNGVPTITLAGNVIFDGAVNTTQMQNNAATAFTFTAPASTTGSPVNAAEINIGNHVFTTVAGSSTVVSGEYQVQYDAGAISASANQLFTFRLYVDGVVARAFTKTPPLVAVSGGTPFYAWTNDIITMSYVASGLSAGAHTISLTVIKGTGAGVPATNVSFTNVLIKTQESRR